MSDQEFKYHGLVHRYERYHDFEFTDGDPRCLYRVTYDSVDMSWYGVICKSETDDGDFEVVIDMSPLMLMKLRNLIPKDDRKFHDYRFEQEAERMLSTVDDIRKGVAIAVVWTDFDVHSIAEAKDLELTDAEVSEVLYRLKRYHDATIGINWDTIDFHVDEIVRER